MKILLLVLGFIFFGIYFLLAQILYVSSGVVWNLFFEAQLYFFITLWAVCYILYYYRFNSPETHKDEIDAWEETEKFSLKSLAPSRSEVTSGVKNFFGKYMYYIGCASFYIALCILIHLFLGDNSTWPLIFLLTSICIVGLYLFQRDFPVFQDFLGLNTAIVSLYYFAVEVYILLGNAYSLSLIDGVNITLLIIASIVYFLYVPVKYSRPYIATYSAIFYMMTMWTLLTYFFTDAIFWGALVFVVMTTICLQMTQKVETFFQISPSLVRTWWGVSSCFAAIFLYVEIYQTSQLSMLFLYSLLLGYVAYQQFFFHAEYENYLCLSFASVSACVIMLSWYMYFFPIESFPILFVMCLWAISVAFLVFDGYTQNPYAYDTYFYHIFSLIVNISCVISFFILGNITILSGALFLLLESLYFFFSYYSLNGQKSHENSTSRLSQKR